MPVFVDWVQLFGFCLIPAYLVGSVPYGFLIGRLQGVDLRQRGSGNIGATNAWRVLGKTWGALTFILDFGKAPLAAFLIQKFALAPSGGGRSEVIQLLILWGAVLGHNYPIWLRFKGGKGIATSAGGLLWLMPPVFWVVLGVWVVVFALTRYVSAASLSGALAFPIATAVFYGHSPGFLVLSIFLAAMAFGRHRSNIQRLFQGTEHRWSSPKTKKGGPS